MPTGGTVNRKFGVQFVRSALRQDTPPFCCPAFFLATKSNLEQGWYDPTKLLVLGLATDGETIASSTLNVVWSLIYSRVDV
jgi:hypothetical protein